MMSSTHKETLLSDEQVMRFIVNGFLLLEPEQPQDVHDKILCKTAEAFATEGNPGNNIIAKVPEIQQILESPRLRGTLESLLGESYFLHPYRHCHLSLPSRKAQIIHKDSYWGHRGIRQHRPRWFVIMYYPQDTTVDMGPLSVIPGTHYLDSPNQDDSMSKDFLQLDEKKGLLTEWQTTDMPLPCKAGSVLLFHHHLFHYAMANNSDRASYMFKFVVCRMDEPVRPTWNADPHFIPTWDSGPCPEGADIRLWENFRPALTEAYTQVWSWLTTGSAYTVTNNILHDHETAIDEDDATPPKIKKYRGDIDMKKREIHAKLKSLENLKICDAIDIFKEDLHSTSAVQRCRAVYVCAEFGVAAVPLLMKAFLEGAEDTRWAAMHGLASVSSYAAIELAGVLLHPDEFVRSAAAYALGESLHSQHCDKEQFNYAVKHLINAFSDPSLVVQSCSLSALTHIIQRNLEHVTGEQLRQVCDVFVSKLHEKHFDPFVNQGTCLALTRVAPLMVMCDLVEPVMKYFTEALFSSDRYVSGYAIEGLKRLDTRDSLAQVVQYLTYTHWCPITTISSLY